jgi:predicted peroxiredoxin
MTSQRSLVVKLTAGAESAEKANQAFTVAATAAASGVPVSLWLTGEAVWFAVPGRAASFTLELATPLTELLSTVVSLGTLTVCGQCAGRRSLGSADLVPGARIAGAATFVEEALAEGAQALVY